MQVKKMNNYIDSREAISVSSIQFLLANQGNFRILLLKILKKHLSKSWKSDFTMSDFLQLVFEWVYFWFQILIRTKFDFFKNKNYDFKSVFTRFVKSEFRIWFRSGSDISNYFFLVWTDFCSRSKLISISNHVSWMQIFLFCSVFTVDGSLSPFLLTSSILSYENCYRTAIWFYEIWNLILIRFHWAEISFLIKQKQDFIITEIWFLYE